MERPELVEEEGELMMGRKLRSLGNLNGQLSKANRLQSTRSETGWGIRGEQRKI